MSPPPLGTQTSERPPASMTNCLMLHHVQPLSEKGPLKRAIHSGAGAAGPLPTCPSGRRQGREEML